MKDLYIILWVFSLSTTIAACFTIIFMTCTKSYQYNYKNIIKPYVYIGFISLILNIFSYYIIRHNGTNEIYYSYMLKKNDMYNYTFTKYRCEDSFFSKCEIIIEKKITVDELNKL
jgi:Co/Zn/Cd efflux system component